MTIGDTPSNGFQSSTGSIIINYPTALPHLWTNNHNNVTLNQDASH